ncbi:MAG: rhamnogalacturonan acetylesterase [Chthoniobacteraceae bacterium]|nr:rhamnogalacturonan acetylesterase [Chthoniobacteraceae bacterium]
MALSISIARSEESKALLFTFGTNAARAGSTVVPANMIYSSELGYGFEAGPPVMELDDSVSSHQPFFFSVQLPEGNYNVTVTLGNKTSESTTTVKAETRRLLLEEVHTGKGQFETRTFTVNVRTPAIPAGGAVKINGRETGPPLVLHWDDKLTLEFNNAQPSLAAVEIRKNDDAITVYLAGDSTVTDQVAEPWNGWGQMLPRFFKPGAAIANHAESGLALRSFLASKRLDKIVSAIKARDYLFIQFGHNDQKEKGEGVGAFTTYKRDLKLFVAQAREKLAIPVLITSMNRRRFDEQGRIVPTLGDYPEAMRQVAVEEQVALIDLNVMSKDLFETLGPDISEKAFVHYPANSFPGQPRELRDDTHFNAYGSYELARCVVEGIRNKVPHLAKLLLDDVQAFDPRHPDSIGAFRLPASPAKASEEPAGN